MAETSKIYVDIHSLLDIRQAILSKLIDPIKLAEFVVSDEYNFRKTDIFKNVDMVEYEKISNEMTADILPRATVTYIVNTITMKLHNLQKRNSYYGETKQPEVLLNVYPFNLSEKQAEIIQNLVFVKLGKACLVTLINKPVEEISPFFIKSLDITTCFIYDASRWIEKHTDALNGIKLPDTLIYFPSVYKVEDTDNEIAKIIKMGFKDIFGYVEFLLSSAVNINFLPILFYSNIVSSSLMIDKYNESLAKTSLGENDGDISTEV